MVGSSKILYSLLSFQGAGGGESFPLPLYIYIISQVEIICTIINLHFHFVQSSRSHQKKQRRELVPGRQDVVQV